MKVKKYPCLYKRTKNGNTAWYQVKILFLKDRAEIHTDKASKIDGKSQNDIKSITEGKNIGRSNETTIKEQAISEADSIFNKLKDKGYKEEKPTGDFNTDANGFMKPMLASKFSEKKHTNFPYIVQPKLDGCRCLCYVTEYGISYLSRGGKPFTTLEHLSPTMQKVFDKFGAVILDGEIYNHSYTFQKITGSLRKKTSTRRSRQLKFRAYDIVNLELTQVERIEQLRKIVNYTNSEKLSLVETTTISMISGIQKFHAKYIELGYEGIMLRDRDGIYEPGYRSKTLIKYKEFDDAEFEIVDVLEATGRDSGTAVFVCITEDEQEFNCRPQGTFEMREQYFDDQDKLIGKKLTVKYQGLSDDGIPRFPVGIEIRDYE